MSLELGFACAVDRLAGGESGGYGGLEIGPQRLLVGSCQRQRLRMLLTWSTRRAARIARYRFRAGASSVQQKA